MVQRMVVTFAALQQAEREIRRCVEEMRGKLEDLATDLAPLTQSWTGDAASAYQQHMREWQSAAGDINDVLGKVAGMVRTAESNYRSAVTTNKNIWPVR
jgi:early secretory antigenic target protein ESAT-6